MLKVKKEKKSAFNGTAAAQSAKKQTVKSFTRSAEAKFDTFGLSSIKVTHNTFTEDGTDYVSYDLALRFLDSMPLDDEHGKSCLVCLSKPEIETIIEMLKSVIEE